MLKYAFRDDGAEERTRILFRCADPCTSSWHHHCSPQISISLTVCYYDVIIKIIFFEFAYFYRRKVRNQKVRARKKNEELYHLSTTCQSAASDIMPICYNIPLYTLYTRASHIYTRPPRDS